MFFCLFPKSFIFGARGFSGALTNPTAMAFYIMERKATKNGGIAVCQQCGCFYSWWCLSLSSLIRFSSATMVCVKRCVCVCQIKSESETGKRDKDI